MRRRFSSLPLLTKILLSTSVALTILFAITGQIVLRHIRRTVSDSLEEEVHNSFQAYTSLLKSRAELLSSVSRIMATLPEVRLAFNTGDSAHETHGIDAPMREEMLVFGSGQCIDENFRQITELDQSPLFTRFIV